MDILGIILLFVGFIMFAMARLTMKQRPDGEDTEEDFIAVLIMMSKIIKAFAYMCFIMGICFIIISRII